MTRVGVYDALFRSGCIEAFGSGLRRIKQACDEAGVRARREPGHHRGRHPRREPAAHQAKKGQNWHFGHELGVGAGAETGVPHSVHMDAANARDLDQVPDLVRKGDERVWADAGYVGVGRRPEVAGDPSLSGVEWIVVKRRSQVGEDDLVAEAAKSAARSVVEHVFRWVKSS